MLPEIKMEMIKNQNVVLIPFNIINMKVPKLVDWSRNLLQLMS